MTLLPLDEIRLNARSHASALRWIGLIYCRPTKVRTAEQTLNRGQRVTVVVRIHLHALVYLALLCWLAYRFLELPPPPAWKITLLLLGACSLTMGLVRGLGLGLLLAGGLYDAALSSSDAGAFAFFLGSFVAGFGAAILSQTFNYAAPTVLIGGLWFMIMAQDVPPTVTAFIAFPFWIGVLRLYYLPLHFLWLWLRHCETLYRFHPIAWDEVCLLPFPGLGRLLVRYATHDTEAVEREIDRLIDEYPFRIHRPAALRARAILVVRRAAAVTDLAQLDEVLTDLPAGESGFLKQTPELRRRVHEITALQMRLDILDRPFLREPFAALLVKEIEIFEQQIAGFKPPLSTEFRKAARQWLVVARRQLDAARAAAREPTRQVFRAGDPVDREREAFVPRDALVGELERQVMLATGCPGLLVYGRRRMGKSTLLRNLYGLLPPRVLVANLSMQEARAFTSLPDLVALIFQRVASVLPDGGELSADLKGLERFLNATQKRLDADDHRLLLAIDEYENLDAKIGEGTLSEDLLAVIRESIQTHRRLIWAFAGSHAIDELVHAPWTSYLVSARTIEVTPFEPAETRLLLTRPLKHSSLWRASGSEPPRFEPGFWGEGGIERIHAQAGGWPHLVQLVAETVVDLVNDAGGASVDGALLERALDRAVVRGNNVFLELLERESRLPGEWDYLRGFRKVEEQPVPEDEALDRSLRRRRLVVEEDGGYRLRVPLMGRWLRQRV
jgi:hypothetical protein